MCLLEAMSAGVPVIAGVRSGGVPWTLGNGTAGLLVDVQKANDIADGLRKLHTDIELQERYIKNSYQLLDQRHTTDAVAKAYVRELEYALAGAARS
jgi:glycosyltransferase involved in cell wall biosynthesis